MKKIGLLLGIMLLVICLTSTAFADAFTLHSGVMFGMTIEEVEKLEKEAGFSTEVSSYVILRDEGATELEVSGTIAGVSDATIEYIFYDNKLVEADYRLYSAYTTGEYNTFLSTMKNKYGEPNAPEAWITALDKTLVTGRTVKVTANQMFGDTINKIDSAVWLIEQSDGSFISIDLVNINKTDTKNKTTDLPFITYAIFTSDEVNAILSGVDNYQNKLSDDL